MYLVNISNRLNKNVLDVARQQGGVSLVGRVCMTDDVINSYHFIVSYRDNMYDDDEDDDDMFDQVASFKGAAQSYQLNFAPGIRNLHAHLETAVCEGANRLTTLQRT